MLNELNALEDKLVRLLELYRDLRTENGVLREQLDASLAERERMAGRMADASARLESLAHQLPEAKG